MGNDNDKTQRHPAAQNALDLLDSARCVVDREELGRALDQLAIRLTCDLIDDNPLLVNVLNGGAALTGALLTRLKFPLEVAAIRVSRYRAERSGGVLHWHDDGDLDEMRVAGRTIVLVDDVLDEGHTLAALVRWFEGLGAQRVLSAVTVRKDVSPQAAQADYIAIEAPDEFLIGFGMDVAGYWRNLDAIYALPPLEEAEEAPAAANEQPAADKEPAAKRDEPPAGATKP